MDGAGFLHRKQPPPIPFRVATSALDGPVVDDGAVASDERKDRPNDGRGGQPAPVVEEAAEA